MDDLKKVCSKRLKALNGNITAQDKLDALDHAKISRPTLEKYLIGKAVKIETATTLIKFFEGRIKERITELETENV